MYECSDKKFAMLRYFYTHSNWILFKKYFRLIFDHYVTIFTVFYASDLFRERNSLIEYLMQWNLLTNYQYLVNFIP